jgi:hypothetical protein
LKKLPIDNDQQITDQFIANFRLMKYNCLINLAKCKRKLNVRNIKILFPIEKIIFF